MDEHRKYDPATWARTHGFTRPTGVAPLTDSEQDMERLKNRPKKTERELNIKQVPFRMHRNDYGVLRALLEQDGWKLQTLLTAIVEKYMARNPLIIKLLADWKEENYLGQRLKDGHSLSHRERKGIFDELEGMGELEEEG